MKKKVLFTVMVLSFLELSAQMKNYDMELVHTFVAGDYSPQYIEPYVGAQESSPSAYYFDIDGNIYVGDWTFKRIVKYDKDFNFIEDYKKLKSSRYYNIIIRENLVFASSRQNLLIESLDKTVIFRYNRNKEINNEAFNKNFTYVNGIVTFSTMDGSVYTVSNPSSDAKANVIEKVTVAVAARSLDTPYIGKYANFIQYKDNYVQKKNDSVRSLDTNNKSLDSISIWSPESMSYIGTDTDGNIYWNDTYKNIIIFNSDNQFIDAFSFDVPNVQIAPVIHPNGDVYFMDITNERAELLRVKRVW